MNPGIVNMSVFGNQNTVLTCHPVPHNFSLKMTTIQNQFMRYLFTGNLFGNLN